MGTGDGSYGGAVILFTIPLGKNSSWSMDGIGINRVLLIEYK